MATGRRRSDMPWRILLFYQCGGAERAMGIELLSDESVLRFHEDIRQQVAADLGAGNRYRFVGEVAKQRAERLRIEIARRRLRCNLIEWRDV